MNKLNPIIDVIFWIAWQKEEEEKNKRFSIIMMKRSTFFCEKEKKKFFFVFSANVKKWIREKNKKKIDKRIQTIMIIDT